MAQWEYLKTTSDDGLSRLGTEGWELVAVVNSGSDWKITFYFKRPAPSFRERVTEYQKRRYYGAMGVQGREESERP